MSRNRDDFSRRTRNRLADRAGHRCSYCKTPTIGPSDEAPDAVTDKGVAAHIKAASSGPGARRHDPEMSAEERSSIENGIWLCGSCSTVIDRDDVRFTVEALQSMKRDHTEFARLGEQNLGDVDIMAIGPDLIAAGQVTRFGPNGVQLRIAFFIHGTPQDLMVFVQDFEKRTPLSRYIVLADLGRGGLLLEAPTIEQDDSTRYLSFRWQPAAPRRDASQPIAGVSAQTGRIITGLDYLAQTFERCLGHAKGSWFASIDGGSYVSELYWRFRDSPWFAQLLKVEVARLSSIPSSRSLGLPDNGYPPLLCVNQVHSVRVPSFDLDDKRKLRVEFDLELEGHGRWSGDLLVYIYDPYGLELERANAVWMKENIRRIESGGNSLPTMLPPEGWRIEDGFP